MIIGERWKNRIFLGGDTSMKQIWRIELDRYSDESRAKSGRIFSLLETSNLIFEAYQGQKNKPKLEIVVIGVGMALADILEDRKIPLKRVKGLLTRIGGADIFKYKSK